MRTLALLERVAPSGGAKTYLSPGEATPWCDVTRAIHEDTGARMELRGAERYSYTEWLPALDATFDFATAPDDAAIVKSFRKHGEGAGLSIIVPGVVTAENVNHQVRSPDDASITPSPQASGAAP